MSRSLRRLMKEATELTTSPSPHFHAQPVSESNLYDWHFTLAGPPSPSPYAGGIYHGRIVLPPTYPLRPPSFRFLTPSGRFEVNREICLSISGHHEETWQPAWGIRTALTAIRSFMDGDARGQVGGLEVSDELRREYARVSRGWCCEVCEGTAAAAEGDSRGKSNEEVLREWREFCREKGVDVDREDTGDGEVPRELRLGDPKAKKTTEGDNGSSERKVEEEGAGMASSTGPAQVSTTGSQPVEQQSPLQVPPQQQRAVPQTLTSTSISTSTAVIQAPPRTTAAPAPAPAPRSQETPWLDRAIFGVLIALVLMILRRIASVEDY